MGRDLTRIGKLLLFAVLAINIPVNIAILTHDIPSRAEGYSVGDGLCDYTGESASIGLFENIRGKYYENGEELLLIGYEVRPLWDLRNDRLVGEYSSRLEWLAYLDRGKMSNGRLIKTIIMVVSIVFLVLAGFSSGMGSAFNRKLPIRGPFDQVAYFRTTTNI